VRLFIGIELGERVVEKVEREVARLSRRAPEARWVRAENAHLTLAFLGEVDEALVPRLEAVLERVAGRHPPLTLTLEGGGGFGSSRRPRVLWLDLGGDVPLLADVHADLWGELVPLGFEPERRDFRPHLTLARAKDPRGDPALAECVEALAKVDLGEARIGRLVLFRSHLSPKGARYQALFTAPLR
jgi:RNA 2',3'-cyclic 3'-phosphodiesterase